MSEGAQPGLSGKIRPTYRALGPDGNELWRRAVIRTGRLRPLEKVFLLVIALYDWDDLGQGCTASLETLAAQVRCCPRTAKATYKRLKELGLISTERRVMRTNVTRVRREQCLRLPAALESGWQPMYGAIG